MYKVKDPALRDVPRAPHNHNSALRVKTRTQIKKERKTVEKKDRQGESMRVVV